MLSYPRPYVVKFRNGYEQLIDHLVTTHNLPPPPPKKKSCAKGHLASDRAASRWLILSVGWDRKFSQLTPEYDIVPGYRVRGHIRAWGHIESEERVRRSSCWDHGAHAASCGYEVGRLTFCSKRITSLINEICTIFASSSGV